MAAQSVIETHCTQVCVVVSQTSVPAPIWAHSGFVLQPRHVPLAQNGVRPPHCAPVVHVTAVPPAPAAPPPVPAAPPPVPPRPPAPPRQQRRPRRHGPPRPLPRRR